MELFVINRYLGDSPNQTSPPIENELKQKWLLKVEERKKLRETALNHTQTPKSSLNSVKNGENETNSLIEENEKKKLKSQIKSQNHESSSIVYDSERSTKRKRKNQSDSYENSTAEKPKRGDELKFEEVKPIGNDVDDDIVDNTSFTVLGGSEIKETKKVKRVLPSWLANPSVIPIDLKHLKATVDSIADLNETFVKKLTENKITHFFPVQAQLIPYLLSNIKKPRMYWPNDICVSAPTGSGKTLAFVLPILQDLYKCIIPNVKALVVLPVQDLASQVFKVFKNYSVGTGVKVVLLKSNIPMLEEQKQLVKQDASGCYQSLVHIIVTTPGRLVDHLKSTSGLNLQHLKYLVIDEADRVMENIQNDWLFHLNRHLFTDCSYSYKTPVLTLSTLATTRRPPQKLLFSATLSQDPEKLQQLGLFQPKLFTSVVDNKIDCSQMGSDERLVNRGDFIGKFTTPAELKEYFVISTKNSRPLVLYHLILQHKWTHILCFVQSTESAHRLSILLRSISKRKLEVAEMSASLLRNKREKILEKFSNGVINVLISTDALARGIDIPDVECVISYEPPKYIKNYIHRVGRTGRAGKFGTAITLLSSNQVNAFQEMTNSAGKIIEELIIKEDDLEQYSDLYIETLNELRINLNEEEVISLKKTKIDKRVNITAGKKTKKIRPRKRVRKKTNQISPSTESNI